MTINLKVTTPSSNLIPRIAVLGIGGAGGNAVNNMIEAKLEGVEFLVANTDTQALGRSHCETRIQLGRGVTRGLGAGSQPEVGRAAAEEALDEVRAALGGFTMVFIAAGMGGGTGTGGAPVVAQAAHEDGILSVGVMTKPFAFEGPRRMRVAETGLQEVQRHLDTLLVIPNQNLFLVADKQTTFTDAFRLADQVVQDGVRAVTDLIVRPGLINLDFADVRTVVAGMGRAMMGVGEAAGDDRAIEAARAAIANPLLEGLPLDEVRSLLVNVSGGEDLTLHEIEAAVGQISGQLDPSINLTFGSALDAELTGRMRVSVVATGTRPSAPQARERTSQGVTLSLVSSQDRDETGDSGDAAERPKPAVSPARPETAAARSTAGEPVAALLPGEDEPVEAPGEASPAATRPVNDDSAEQAASSTRTAPPDGPESAQGLPEAQVRDTGGPGFIVRLMAGFSLHPEDLFEKAERCYHGHGVPKDLSSAFRYYCKAAKRGHASAQNRLGWMLERGEGTEADPAEAVRWHRRAAEQGHLNAMNDLGYLYRQGHGVPQDFDQALHWFHKAAARNYGYAEFNLGQLYEHGWGVERDLGEAVTWYRRAASRDHEWARKRLKDLGVAP